MMRYVVYLVGLVFLAWTASTSLTQVRPGERAVIRRFGRILPARPEPGLYVGWPWGIERVDRENVSFVRRVTVGFTAKDDKEDETVPAGQMLTGDHNLVNVEAAIHYKIREADVSQFVLQKDNVEAYVARAAETLLAEWIAGRRVDDVLRRGKADLPAFLLEHLQERVKSYELGIEVEQASITRLEPPEQVKEAFERLTQAETSIRTQRNQADEKAGRMRSEMQSKIVNLEDRAVDYAKEATINAKAEASRFRKRLDQYRELSATDPDYLNALWLDEMTRLYAKMRESGRIDVLDHFLTSEGLSITQFPLPARKK
jgi:membrane protease subunit HflK